MYPIKDKLMLTPFIHSVSSLQGKFKGLFLSEEDAEMFQPEGNIVGIASNFGENWADGYCDSKENIKKSNRGRKKKQKIKKKRKRKGNGKHLNSQITFHCKSHFIRNKIYKFKCFRTETFNVPGVLNEDFSDVYPSLTDLLNYHRSINMDKTIKLVDVHPFLTNYKCKISNTKYLAELREITNLLEQIKNDETESVKIKQIVKNSRKIDKNMSEYINKYIPVNRYGIAELKYEPERFPSGMTIKFYRPKNIITDKAHEYAKSTVKIFNSGKINLDAIKSRQEVYDLYVFINHIFAEYENILLFDTERADSSSSDTDDDDF